MASQAPINNALPLLYGGLEALNSAQHGNMKLKRLQTIPQVGRVHAVPITLEEFVHAQRDYPIIFSAGENPVPLALMGLNEGVNTFLDADGLPIDKSTYMPAYLRRYPFLLAKLQPESDDLSLCFDPTSGGIVEGDEGEALFENGEPTELTRNILQFCEQFEIAGQRTQAFMNELQSAGLLMEGEVSIQPDNVDQPFIYRGFQMVDEEKLRNMRGDELRKWNQSGHLAMIFAHLMSLSVIRDLFYRQVTQGKGPSTAAADAKNAMEKADAKA